MSIRNEITKFGFDFGALEVARVSEGNGYATVRVITEHCTVFITATPKGQNIFIEAETKTSKGRIKTNIRRGEKRGLR
jgi:hypothetical protein